MNIFPFQKWIACVVMVAMLFNMAAPVAVCKCEGCYCPKSIARIFSEPSVEDKKCGCLPIDEENFTSETSCPCRCCGIQDNETASSPAILPTKQTNPNLSGVIASTLSTNFVNNSGLPFRAGDCRTLFQPHVPIHVLLCVFLN